MQFIRSVASHASAKQPWERMAGESAKAYAAFVEFKDFGSERTYKKVAEKLKKSLQLMARWGQKYNWHNRAADFDEYDATEVQRAMLARRIRLQQRALNIADQLDEKAAEAIKLLQVARVVKVDGEPDQLELTISPHDIARMIEVSQKIQTSILGDGKDDRTGDIYVNIGHPDPKYNYEQPAAMAEARRKAEAAAQPRTPPGEEEEL